MNMPQSNLHELVYELQELSNLFNKRVNEIENKYFTDSEALAIIHRSDGTIGFGVDIEKLK